MGIYNENELYSLDLKTDEQKSEYMLELAKAKARIDAELFYKNSSVLRKSNSHNSFIFSLILGVVSLCIGFWISYLTK